MPVSAAGRADTRAEHRRRATRPGLLNRSAGRGDLCTGGRGRKRRHPHRRSGATEGGLLTSWTSTGLLSTIRTNPVARRLSAVAPIARALCSAFVAPGHGGSALAGAV